MSCPIEVSEISQLPSPPWTNILPTEDSKLFLTDGENIARTKLNKLRQLKEIKLLKEDDVCYVAPNLTPEKMLLGMVRKGHVFAWNCATGDLLLIEGLPAFATDPLDTNQEQSKTKDLLKRICGGRIEHNFASERPELAIQALHFCYASRRLALIHKRTLYSWSFSHSRALAAKGKDQAWFGNWRQIPLTHGPPEGFLKSLAAQINSISNRAQWQASFAVLDEGSNALSLRVYQFVAQKDNSLEELVLKATNEAALASSSTDTNPPSVHMNCYHTEERNVIFAAVNDKEVGEASKLYFYFPSECSSRVRPVLIPADCDVGTAGGPVCSSCFAQGGNLLVLLRLNEALEVFSLSGMRLQIIVPERSGVNWGVQMHLRQFYDVTHFEMPLRRSFLKVKSHHKSGDVLCTNGSVLLRLKFRFPSASTRRESPTKFRELQLAESLLIASKLMLSALFGVPALSDARLTCAFTYYTNKGQSPLQTRDKRQTLKQYLQGMRMLPRKPQKGDSQKDRGSFLSWQEWKERSALNKASQGGNSLGQILHNLSHLVRLCFLRTRSAGELTRWKRLWKHMVSLFNDTLTWELGQKAGSGTPGDLETVTWLSQALGESPLASSGSCKQACQWASGLHAMLNRALLTLTRFSQFEADRIVELLCSWCQLLDSGGHFKLNFHRALLPALKAIEARLSPQQLRERELLQKIIHTSTQGPKMHKTRDLKPSYFFYQGQYEKAIYLWTEDIQSGASSLLRSGKSIMFSLLQMCRLLDCCYFLHWVTLHMEPAAYICIIRSFVTTLLPVFESQCSAVRIPNPGEANEAGPGYVLDRLNLLKHISDQGLGNVLSLNSSVRMLLFCGDLRQLQRVFETHGTWRHVFFLTCLEHLVDAKEERADSTQSHYTRRSLLQTCFPHWQEEEPSLTLKEDMWLLSKGVQECADSYSRLFQGMISNDIKLLIRDTRKDLSRLGLRDYNQLTQTEALDEIQRQLHWIETLFVALMDQEHLATLVSQAAKELFDQYVMLQLVLSLRSQFEEQLTELLQSPSSSTKPFAPIVRLGLIFREFFPDLFRDELDNDLSWLLLQFAGVFPARVSESLPGLFPLPHQKSLAPFVQDRLALIAQSLASSVVQRPGAAAAAACNDKMPLLEQSQLMTLREFQEQTQRCKASVFIQRRAQTDNTARRALEEEEKAASAAAALSGHNATRFHAAAGEELCKKGLFRSRAFRDTQAAVFNVSRHETAGAAPKSKAPSSARSAAGELSDHSTFWKKILSTTVDCNSYRSAAMPETSVSKLHRIYAWSFRPDEDSLAAPGFHELLSAAEQQLQATSSESSASHEAHIHLKSESGLGLDREPEYDVNSEQYVDGFHYSRPAAYSQGHFSLDSVDDDDAFSSSPESDKLSESFLQQLRMLSTIPEEEASNVATSGSGTTQSLNSSSLLPLDPVPTRVSLPKEAADSLSLQAENSKSSELPKAASSSSDDGHKSSSHCQNSSNEAQLPALHSLQTTAVPAEAQVIQVTEFKPSLNHALLKEPQTPEQPENHIKPSSHSEHSSSPSSCNSPDDKANGLPQPHSHCCCRGNLRGPGPTSSESANYHYKVDRAEKAYRLLSPECLDKLKPVESAPRSVVIPPLLVLELPQEKSSQQFIESSEITYFKPQQPKKNEGPVYEAGKFDQLLMPGNGPHRREQPVVPSFSDIQYAIRQALTASSGSSVSVGVMTTPTEALYDRTDHDSRSVLVQTEQQAQQAQLAQQAQPGLSGGDEGAKNLTAFITERGQEIEEAERNKNDSEEEAEGGGSQQTQETLSIGNDNDQVFSRPDSDLGGRKSAEAAQCPSEPRNLILHDHGPQAGESHTEDRMTHTANSSYTEDTVHGTDLASPDIMPPLGGHIDISMPTPQKATTNEESTQTDAPAAAEPVVNAHSVRERTDAPSPNAEENEIKLTLPSHEASKAKEEREMLSNSLRSSPIDSQDASKVGTKTDSSAMEVRTVEERATASAVPPEETASESSGLNSQDTFEMALSHLVDETDSFPAALSVMTTLQNRLTREIDSAQRLLHTVDKVAEVNFTPGSNCELSASRRQTATAKSAASKRPKPPEGISIAEILHDLREDSLQALDLPFTGRYALAKPHSRRTELRSKKQGASPHVRQQSSKKAKPRVTFQGEEEILFEPLAEEERDDEPLKWANEALYSYDERCEVPGNFRWQPQSVHLEDIQEILSQENISVASTN